MPASYFGIVRSGYENVRYTKEGSTVDYDPPVDTSSPQYRREITGGTGVNQANIFWRGELTIAASGVVVLDLNGAANADIFGINLAMLTLCDLMVINAPVLSTTAANTTNVTLTTTIAGVLAGGTPNLPIKPGGKVHYSNFEAGGISVITPTTADTITLTNAAGATARVQLAVIGRSI